MADLDEAIDKVSDSSYVPSPQELSLAHPLEPQLDFVQNRGEIRRSSRMA